MARTNCLRPMRRLVRNFRVRMVGAGADMPGGRGRLTTAAASASTGLKKPGALAAQRRRSESIAPINIRRGFEMLARGSGAGGASKAAAKWA